MTPRASQNFVAPRLSATSKMVMETRNAPMFGRNSPRNANTPKMSAGCTPISQSNTPTDSPVMTPLMATPRAQAGHLSHEPRESAMRLFAVTIRRECQIRGYQRARVRQDKHKQKNRQHKAGYAANETNCRSEQNISDCSSGRSDFPGDFVRAWQRLANFWIIFCERFDANTNSLPDAWGTPHQFLGLRGQRRNRKEYDGSGDSDEREHQQDHTDKAR